MDDERLERFSVLFKALADPMRLRILGCLAERPYAGHELAAQVGLTPPTISHHMRKLTEAGLVTVVAEAQSRIYSLRTETLRDMARTSLPANADGADADDKVVRAFFDGERLKQIPAQRKKRVAVLKHLLLRFEPQQDYPEKEVNAILKAAHEDFATLRRELVDYGFMTREKGVYRVATNLPPRGKTVAQEMGNEADWFQDLLAGATRRAISGS